MKTLFTLLLFVSFSSVFAADSGCTDGVGADKAAVRKCPNAAACIADKGKDAVLNSEGSCIVTGPNTTNCPAGVESNKVVDKSDKKDGAAAGASVQK